MEYIEEDERIYLRNNNDVLAEVLFKKNGDNTYDIYHTYVDDSLRGNGIASNLVKMAYDKIVKLGCNVTASCSYAKKWLENNIK